MDLSIIIPACNEMFLAQTIENVLANIRGESEIIAICDNYWPEPPVKDHPRLTLIHRNSIHGQRKSTNDAVKLSTAKYIMKLDAHCAVDEGFDVKMMDKMEDDITMIPIMYNLHAFNWKCFNCGFQTYQGPTPQKCSHCGAEGQIKRKILWRAKPNPESTSYRFDKDLHFQYWKEYKDRQQGDLVETMSAQGSCFMLTRDKYWELDICDEGHGGWGQQGTEIALKTWLSGGRLLVNKTTWYAHMFRTQGGDFGFPYKITSEDVEKARQYSKNLWLNDAWPKAIHKLDWLLDKFKPVPGWHE